MSNNDKFFLEEITGQYPETSGITMLNEIADESAFRLDYVKDTSKVCSFCGQTTEEMFPVYNNWFVRAGDCCKDCMKDDYCASCGESSSEDLQICSFEMMKGYYTTFCEKCIEKQEQKETNEK